MTPAEIKRAAALTIVMDLSRHMAENSGRGRLKTRCEALERAAGRRIAQLRRRLSAEEIVRISDARDRWGHATGWHGKPRHVCTIVSFLIAVVSDLFPEDGRMLGLLREVWDYYDRAGRRPGASDWAGTLAYLKFENVMEAA